MNEKTKKIIKAINDAFDKLVLHLILLETEVDNWNDGVFECNKAKFISEVVKNLTSVSISKASVSISKAKEYAEFCVECDRKGMKLLELNDWLKL